MADLAVDATLTSSGRFSAVRGEGVDSHPQQREDGRKKNGPDDDDSRSAVLPAQQTFEERKTLEDRKKMSGRATNNPELFVSPPILDTHTAPPKLQYTSGKNGDEEKNEPRTSVVAYLQKID
nr:hypothetical protein HannXRQ_Chr01g0031141 [Ipomoea trifida]